ncbi:tyrosine-protein phosphatase [Sorangium sp. So ce1151]|uniref:tyrosine-protein phosphatase n=1 Tax=Sorangium sp. So ce1151 TaxID=3133332 RepID=UPI003F617248
MNDAPRPSGRPPHLHLESVPNMRDLGGYRTRDGRSVRCGMVYRAGSLRHLQPGEAEFLARTLSLRTFYDLRTREEIGAEDRSALLAAVGVRWVNAPIEGLSPEFLRLERPEWEDYASNYVYMLAAARTALHAVVSALAAGDATPLSFGCSLGKDRTGVVAALLLKALDVPDETIAADYAETACCLTRHAARLSWLAADKGIAEDELSRRFRTPASTIERFLAGLAREYGDAGAYLRSAGISEQMVHRLREQLLE